MFNSLPNRWCTITKTCESLCKRKSLPFTWAFPLRPSLRSITLAFHPCACVFRPCVHHPLCFSRVSIARVFWATYVQILGTLHTQGISLRSKQFSKPSNQAEEKTQPRQKMLCQICSSFSLFIVSQDIHSIQELVHDGDRIYMRQTRVRRGPITWVDHTPGGGPSYKFCGSIQIGSAVGNDFFCKASKSMTSTALLPSNLQKILQSEVHVKQVTDLYLVCRHPMTWPWKLCSTSGSKHDQWPSTPLSTHLV